MEALELDLITKYVPIILSLVIMEGLLSIDNAMIIAAMVDHLPEKQKRWALIAGLAGAYFFRGLMIVFAAYLMHWEWLKILGALYLVYLMVDHLGKRFDFSKDESQEEKVYGFWMTVLMIEITDLAFSIDNVIAAVALSDQLWVVITGVFIGIAVLRLLSTYAIELMQTVPILKPIAYVLVGFVGLQLIFQEATHIHIPAYGKFLIISLIVFLGIAHERWVSARRVLHPFIHTSGWLMSITRKVIHAPFKMLSKPKTSKADIEEETADTMPQKDQANML